MPRKPPADNPSCVEDPAYLAEIRSFREEQERIRRVLATISKERGRLSEPLANFIFIAGLIFLLWARFFGHWVDNMLSLELGLLLVSLKIIWMMRVQTRYNHFLFWIVHSIEFRQGEMLTRMDSLKTTIEEQGRRKGGD